MREIRWEGHGEMCQHQRKVNPMTQTGPYGILLVSLWIQRVRSPCKGDLLCRRSVCELEMRRRRSLSRRETSLTQGVEDFLSNIV